LLIFELLDFAAFLDDLTPAPFLCKREQVKPARGGGHFLPFRVGV